MKHFTEDSINLHISTPGSGGTTWTCTGRGRGGSWRGSTNSWLRWAVIGRGRVTWPLCSPLIGPGRQDGVPQVSFPGGVLPSLANHSNRWLQLHLFWQDDYKDDVVWRQVTWFCDNGKWEQFSGHLNTTLEHDIIIIYFFLIFHLQQ